MTFLNAWLLFALIPLLLLYKKHPAPSRTRQLRLLYLSLAFMLLALARPALPDAPVEKAFDSQDYIIALDASYSMQATDIKPTRYAAAKEAIARVLAMHPKDRFTLFAFTSNALLISPPTTDTRISLQALDALNPDYILTKSTSLLALFKTVSKIDSAKKNLIIFTDGGDEHDLSALLEIARKNGIAAYIVATATAHGAALKKDGKYIKNSDSALVVSKINPILSPLAEKSGGHYFELTSPNAVDALSDAISGEKRAKPETITVQSYRELFYWPLAIALVLFFLAVTKLHQLLVFAPLLMLFPSNSHAGLLDSYYLNQAYRDYNASRFKAAAVMFEKTEPSVGSYYNAASAWYKAGKYEKALGLYGQIKTTDPKLKQRLFYNMGNCAARLRQYDRAQQYYINALAFGEDADALFNLNQLRRLKLKTEKKPEEPMVSKGMQKKKQPSQSRKDEQSQDKGGGKSSSNRDSDESAGGQGDGKKEQKAAAARNAAKQPDNYKMGYKAYERINKGYADEKEPW